MRTLSVLALTLLLGACMPKTQFLGAPHYPGGVPACAATCQNQGMEISGFVYSGEFASSCVCGPRHGAQQPAPAPEQGQPQAGLPAAATAAVAGVAAQMQDDDDAARRRRQGDDAARRRRQGK